jgi:hypothetical protein
MLVKDGWDTRDYRYLLLEHLVKLPIETEGNRNLHVVTRVSYPFWSNQIIEPGSSIYR